VPLSVPEMGRTNCLGCNWEEVIGVATCFLGESFVGEQGVS
jgi:hypothetical protein